MATKSSAVTSYPLSTPTPKVRVLVDARKINDGGIGVYTENLIVGLLDSGQAEVGVVGDADFISRKIWAKEVHVQHDDAKPYSIDELLFMSGRLDFRGYDVFHAPHFMLPYRIPIPSVVTVHDTIHIQCPEKRYYPFVASRLIRSAVKRANRVVAVSNATFKDVCALLGSHEELKQKIRVVPNSISPDFVATEISREFIRARFGISGKYLLAVFSMLKPHKGLNDLLRVYKTLKKNHPELTHDLKLVLVGKGIDSLVNTGRFIEEVGAIPGVHVVGSVLREELIQLYGSATALTVSSTAEGFCLPVLEAQALGVPVVARPVPAICELLTRHDRVCTDFSVKSLAEALTDFLREEGEMQGPSREELDLHIRKFNRDDIAKLVLSVYSEAVGV